MRGLCLATSCPVLLIWWLNIGDVEKGNIAPVWDPFTVPT